MKTIPELVREVRGQAKQAEFAEFLGVSRQTVYLWESGKFRPSDAQLAKMGITVEYRREA
jgi:DNA-binding XRE family transcriptional regulator